MSNLKTWSLVFAFIFFVFGLATLADYGVNWDATSHLMRGQAYLHYYLTGKDDYKDLSERNEFLTRDEQIRSDTRRRLYWQNPNTIFFDPDVPKKDIPRVSMYQLDKDLSYISNHYDFGHPHISDVLSSVFNYVLYQKLGIINDIDSYRIYGVLLASVLVGLVFWWTASVYGRFAGVIAALALSTYPLFWAESHFNTEKDIPEAVYYSFLLFSVWRGITTSSWKWIVASGIFFGLAVGTKFNVLFSVFIIVPWLAVYLLSNKSKEFFQKKKKLLFATIVSPFLGLFIYLGTWPYFWENTWSKISQVISFYKTIGTQTSVDPRFLGIFEINTYPAQWIFYTTPLIILFLSSIGIIALVKRIPQKKDKLSVLFLLWLAVPIIRVTLPGTNIYGGVRQIMEFIPALAILTGIGAAYVSNYFKGNLVKIFLLFAFVPIVFKLIEIHPNENTYFNPLIGGLKGAKAQDFPSWGATFGAPYRKAIEWVNKNAEPQAKLTLGTEILSNIPGIFIRPDIDYKSNRSGYQRLGEYVISLRFYGTDKRSYFDMYLDRMIEPVYEENVDGVSILKIWKNDEAHLRSEWKNEKVLKNVEYQQNENGLSFDLGGIKKVSRLELTYDQSNCKDLLSGYIMLSTDGKIWERVPGVLPEEVKIKTLGTQPSNGKFIEPFVGQEVRYINLFLLPNDSCMTNITNAQIYYFE